MCQQNLLTFKKTFFLVAPLLFMIITENMQKQCKACRNNRRSTILHPVLDFKYSSTSFCVQLASRIRRHMEAACTKLSLLNNCQRSEKPFWWSHIFVQRCFQEKVLWSDLQRSLMRLEEVLQGYAELDSFSSGLDAFPLDDFETLPRYLSVYQHLECCSSAPVPAAIAYRRAEGESSRSGPQGDLLQLYLRERLFEVVCDLWGGPQLWLMVKQGRGFVSQTQISVTC